MRKPLTVGITIVLTSAVALMFLYSATPHPKHQNGDHSKPASDEAIRRTVDPATPVVEDSEQPVAFVTVANGNDMESLRIFVGSIHHYHPSAPIVIYVSTMTKEQLLESRNWEHTEIVPMQHVMRDEKMTEEDFVPLAIHDAAELYGAAIYIPKSLHLKRTMSVVIKSLFEKGYVAAACEGDLVLSQKEFCRDISQVIGFVHNSTATRDALDVASKCVIQDLCRGSVFAEMIHNIADVQRIVTPVTVLRRMNLDNKNDPAHELASHLRERDAYIHHAASGSSSPSDTDDKSPAVPGKDKHEHAKPAHSTEGKKHICLLVPSTTKGKNGEQLEQNPGELPFFNLFVRSLVQTVRADAATDKYAFTVFLGIDIGDPIYDHHVHFDKVQSMFNDMTQDMHAHLRVKKFGSEYRGKPAWFWNGLFEEAYRTDTCDYFYQVNDDVEFLTDGWLPRFVEKLATNPRRADLGMAGPGDVGNQKTMTQSFTHRTHFDIFQTYYPRSLQNWYSDDWATHIYDDVGSTFWMRDIGIRNHNPKGTRYTECTTCEQLYLQEIASGKQRLQEYLSSN